MTPRKVYSNEPKSDTTTIVLFQEVVFEKCWDYPEDADTAKRYMENLRGFRGYYHLKYLSDAEFRELMGITQKVISDPELAHAVGALVRQ